MTVAKLVAPLAPFYADELYHDLGGKKESVHLDKWPVSDKAAIDLDLEARMDMAQRITSMVLALRRKVNIKVRQPLAQIMVPAIDDTQRQHITAMADLIKSEVNVKELNFVEGQGILVKKVKCNFRVMGKKYGKLMKDVAAKMNSLNQDEIAQFEQSGREQESPSAEDGAQAPRHRDELGRPAGEPGATRGCCPGSLGPRVAHRDGDPQQHVEHDAGAPA